MQGPEPLVELEALEQLSPLVIRILAPNGGPFTMQGTNTYLVGSGNQRILIDTGGGEADYWPRLEKVLLQENASVSAILLTHWHQDHVGGLQELVEQRLGKVPAYKWKVVDEKTLSNLNDAQLFAESYASDIVNGQIFKCNGATLSALFTAGHTTDHVSFVLQEEGNIFAGDSVLGQSYSTVFESLGDYIRSLEKLRESLNAHQGTHLYPGHGPLVENGLERLENIVQHRMAREKQIFDTLAELATPVSVMSLVQHIYAGYPESVHAAAAHTVMQHLEKLQEDGKVECKNDDVWSVKMGSKL